MVRCGQLFWQAGQHCGALPKSHLWLDFALVRLSQQKSVPAFGSLLQLTQTCAFPKEVALLCTLYQYDAMMPATPNRVPN